MGLEAGAVSEPDGVEGLPGLGAVQGTPGQARGHGDVVGGTQGGDEVVLLEDEADVAGAEPGPLGGTHPGGEGAEHGHLSAGGLIEAGHAVQQRGLARPGGPDDGGEAALGQVGVDVVQGGDAGVLASGDLVDAGEAAQPDGDGRRRARPGRRGTERQAGGGGGRVGGGQGRVSSHASSLTTSAFPSHPAIWRIGGGASPTSRAGPPPRAPLSAAHQTPTCGHRPASSSAHSPQRGERAEQTWRPCSMSR